jgi:hypothetical protein
MLLLVPDLHGALQWMNLNEIDRHTVSCISDVASAGNEIKGSFGRWASGLWDQGLYPLTCSSDERQQQHPGSLARSLAL